MPNLRLFMLKYCAKMRNLRLYYTDASFKADEINAGGTGNDIESIVPGIVKTLDERKMYFNPHDKEILFHTLTVNYKDSFGNLIADSDTIRSKYISGVSQEIVVTPKTVEDYIPRDEAETVTIPDDGVVDFVYDNKYIFEPLTFKIISGGTIKWSCVGYSQTIRYKKNGGEWTNITSSEGAYAPEIVVSPMDTLQFLGDNEYYGTSGGNYNYFACSDVIFEVEGNIMSLIDSTGYTTNRTLTGFGYTFYSLFGSCTGLTSAHNLILPATTLVESCYNGMFYGCTSLTTAPALPATTLALGCYGAMFAGCTALTTAPKLPAMTLADYCYGNMFSRCTSLTTAPELPATTLAMRCYDSMFNVCTSLTTAPELPATTLASNCYNTMFYGCTSLNYIKCLATDISASHCTTNWVNGVAESGLFEKDTNMTGWTIGTNGIPVNWVVNRLTLSKELVYLHQSGETYQLTIYSQSSNWSASTNDSWISLSQYNGNSGKTTISITVVNTVNTRSGKVTFVDDNDVTIDLVVEQTDYFFEPLTFEITSGGSILWYYKGSSTSNRKAIEYKKNNGEWTTILGSSYPQGIPVSSGDVVLFRGNNQTYSTGDNTYNCFCGTTCGFKVSGNIMSLINSSEFTKLSTIASAYTFNYMFSYCSGLTDAGNLILPATSLKRSCYGNMFKGCVSFTVAPKLPATRLAMYCYSSMFRDNTNLTTAPELPATTLDTYCYRYMFNGCTSLTMAPALPATALTDYCYGYMFGGCTSLTTAPMLPATTMTPYCYQGMFNNCTSLTSSPNLPALSLANYCYHGMFSGCTNLTIVQTLPATALSENCYNTMFCGCIGLTTAPELLATNIKTGSYSYMFYGCTQLNYVKCLGTGSTETYCTNSWLYGVSSSGTFIKHPSKTWERGASGVPYNWTIENATL